MKDKETLVATMPQEVLDEQQLSREITDIEFQAEAMVIATDDDYQELRCWERHGC